jgi:hypothetical protein
MMTELADSNSDLNRLHGRALGVGAVFTIFAIVGFVPPGLRDQFYSSYLFSYLFILGIALGSLGITMLHHMTGGDWGYCIRRITESSAMTMPLLTLLFIPIALNTQHLFPWANPDIVNGDKILEHQRVWMNWNFWALRACIYFAVWNLLALLMYYGSSKYDRTGDPWLVVRMQRICSVGLFLYVVTMSFAAVDWIMAREAHWYSSIIGLVMCVSQVLSALVLSLIVLRAIQKKPGLVDFITPPRLNDLGNLFLTFTILWAYMNFAQFLIIWMGNTAPDTPWYVRRGLGGDPAASHWWKFIAGLLLLVHFFIPFFILLGRSNKRRIEPLSTLAMLMLMMRAIDCFWWAGPTSLLDRGKEITKLTPRSIHWLDLVMPLALFGIWLSVMLIILKWRPVLARVEHGPETEPGGHHAHAAA